MLVLLRRLSLPLAALTVLVGGAVALIVLAQNVGSGGAPAAAPPFRPPAVGRIAYDVQGRDGPVLRLAPLGATGATVEAKLAPDARVEILRPARLEEVAPGDLLIVTGVPDDTKNFAIRSVIAIASGAPGDDGLPRSPAGFAGDEVARTPGERPIIGGRVQQVDDGALTIDGPQGRARIGLPPAAPLFRLASATVDDIRQGERVALLGDPAAVSAVLVVAP